MSSDIDTAKKISWRALADELIKENKACYLKDANGEYYFGDIVHNGEACIELSCFSPSQKAGKKFLIRWITVMRFDEYRGER